MIKMKMVVLKKKDYKYNEDKCNNDDDDDND